MSRQVAVVGGGIAGLATAHFLVEAGVHVVLLEAADRLGGKIRTEELAGQHIDVGADAFLVRDPHARALATSLGLGGDLRAPVADRVWLRSRGDLRRMPSGTFFGVPTDLRSVVRSGVLSPRGLARLLSAPLRRSAPLQHDASVASVVAPKFGAEVVERLVEPLLGGVYAGRADELSVRATIPLLAEAAAAGGDLRRELAGRAPRRGAERADPVFLTVEGGLGRLVAAIAERLPDVRRGTEVEQIAPVSSGWSLRGRDVELDADAIVLATPATVTARLLGGVSSAASRGLAAFRYASVAVVSLAFPRAATRRIPEGSGVLVPRSEGGLVKAVTLSSQKWPHLAGSQDPFLLRASIGRIDAPPPDLDDEVLVDAVVGELAQYLGVAGYPEAWRVTRWPESMPQYDVGHRQRIGAVEERLRRDAPGVYLAGAAYDGVGIAHCVRQAREVAFVIAV